MRHARALAVPVRRLFLSISRHFYAILFMCASQPKITKNTKNSYFWGSKSFTVIDVDTIKRRATSARYDKHVCVYLQAFSRYTSQCGK